MIYDDSFKNKNLKTLFINGKASKIHADWQPRILKILDTLDQAEAPEDLDQPGYGFHELKGKRKGVFAVSVSRNWRLTFQWDEESPYNIDLEDYH